MSADDHVFDVCIVGGGLGGLATAVALLLAGFDNIIICERDKQVFDRKQGYGLTLTNSVTGPLARLQLLDTCIEQNCLSQSHYTFTSSGEIIGYYGRLMKKLTAEKDNSNSDNTTTATESDMSKFGGSRGNLRIPRQDLRDMMFDKIQHLLQVRQSSHKYEDMIRWGYKFSSYEETEDFVTTNFELAGPQEQSKLVSIRSRVLLGADGIRSKIRVQRDLKLRYTVPTAPTTGANSLGLHYLGINVILGISAIEHPLLFQKGYYVVDGVHRLFTMPYYTPSQTSSSASSSSSEKPLIMWQLSYGNISESDAMALRTLPSDALLALALAKVNDWFPCSKALLEATVPGEIWSTPLYDREAMRLQTRDKCSRVTLLGDACHPMSMMKGQGANQALEDAILFAEYFDPQSMKNNTKNNINKKLAKKAQKRPFDSLQACPSESTEPTVTEDQPAVNEPTETSPMKALSLSMYSTSSIYCKIRNFEREMVARSFPKVLASREAAQAYHAPEIVQHSFGINGIKDERQVAKVLELCKAQGVTAYLEAENALDAQFEAIVKQVVFADGNSL